MVWWLPMLSQAFQPGGPNDSQLLGDIAGIPGTGTVGKVAGAAANPLGAAAGAVDEATGGQYHASDVANFAQNPEGAIVGAALDKALGKSAPEPFSVGVQPGGPPPPASAQPLLSPPPAPSANTATSFKQDDGQKEGTGWYNYSDGSQRYIAGPEAQQLYKEQVKTGNVPFAEEASNTPAAPTAATTPEQGMADLGASTQRLGESEANAQRMKAQGLTDLATAMNDQAVAEKANGWVEQKRQQANIEDAQKSLKQVQETKIDPLRSWNSAPWYGKAIAALVLATADPRALGPLVTLAGKYMESDLRAQEDDKNSQVSYWTRMLGDAQSGKQAAEIKMRQGWLDQLDAIKAKGGANEAAAGVDVVRDKLQQDLDKTQAGFLERQQARADQKDYQDRSLELQQENIDLRRESLNLKKGAAAQATADREKYLSTLPEAERHTETALLAYANGTGQKVKDVHAAYQKYREARAKTAPLQGVIQDTLAVIKPYFQSGDVPGQGTFAGMAPNWWTSKEGMAVRQNLGNLTALYGKDLSGAQMSDDERKIIKGLIAGQGNFDDINRGVNIIKRMKDRELGALDTGNVYSRIYDDSRTIGQQQDASNVLKNAPREPAASAAPAAAPAPSSGPGSEADQRYLGSLNPRQLAAEIAHREELQREREGRAAIPQQPVGLTNFNLRGPGGL